MVDPVEQFYQEHWQEEDRSREGGEMESILFALRSLGNLSGRDILDVGGGAGRDALLLTEAGGKVTLIDISQSAVEQAAQKGLTAFRCDPFKDDVRGVTNSGPWDVIWIDSILMHVDAAGMIECLYPLLKEGGLIASIEPLRNHPLLFFYRKFLSPYRQLRPSYVSFSEHRTLFLRKGMKIKKEDVFHLIGIFGASLALFKGLFDRTDHLLLKTPLRRFGWLSVIIAQK